MPQSFEIVLVSRRPSFSDEGTFSVTVRSREKTMETVGWRPRKLRLQQREKNLWGRVLVVTAVTFYRLSKNLFFTQYIPAFLEEKLNWT